VASTAFLAGKKTSSFIFGQNVTRVKILLCKQIIKHPMTIGTMDAIRWECKSALALFNWSAVTY